MRQKYLVGLVLIIGLLVGQCITQDLENTETDIDEQIVQAGLEKFIDETENRLSHEPHYDSLEQTWNQNIESAENFETLFELLVSTIDTRITEIEAVRDERSSECQIFSDNKTQILSRLDELTTLRNSLVLQNSSNSEKIENIFDDKCQTHLNYLNFLKSSQITLRLLEFLKQAIESYSLVQIRSVGKILSQYKNSKMNNQDILQAMLAELKQVDENAYKAGHSLENQSARRTSEEIGTGHIDDGREQIEVDTFESSGRRLIEDYKSEILGIIEKIRTNLNDEITSRQNNEIDLNERVIQWTTNINQENEALGKQIQQLDSERQEVFGALATFGYLTETCNAELQWVNDKLSGYQQFRQELIDSESLWRARYELETQPAQDTELPLPDGQPSSSTIDNGSFDQQFGLDA